MDIRRRIMRKLQPIISRVIFWYLSKPRFYRYDGLKVKIYPGVFHPGLFYSTKTLLRFLATQDLAQKRVLELGAGSGLISVYCAKKQAIVTSTDIAENAIIGLLENAKLNGVNLEVTKSDIFEHVDPNSFDLIIINPPYYPKRVTNESDLPWFCGENFEYFTKLFTGLGTTTKTDLEVLMILSEDCNMEVISSIANDNYIGLKEILREKVNGELQFIFQISKISTKK